MPGGGATQPVDPGRPIGACGAVLARLLRRVEAHVFAAERLHGDDTIVPVLGKCKTDTRATLGVSMDGPRGTRAHFGGQTINRLPLSIRSLMQLALLASMRSADRRPITFGGHLRPDRPSGFGRSRSDRLSSHCCSPSHCRD